MNPHPPATLSLRPPDLLLLCTLTKELQDAEGSVYWITTAASVLERTPFPRVQQNLIVFNHLFQQCVERRATDAGINVCNALERYVIAAKGENAPELRCGPLVCSLQRSSWSSSFVWCGVVCHCDAPQHY